MLVLLIIGTLLAIAFSMEFQKELQVANFLGMFMQLLGITLLSLGLGIFIDFYASFGNILWSYTSMLLTPIFNTVLGVLLLLAGRYVQKRYHMLIKPDPVFDQLDEVPELKSIDTYAVLDRLLEKINQLTLFSYVIVILTLEPALNNIDVYTTDLQPEVELFNFVYSIILFFVIIIFIYLNYELKNIVLNLRGMKKPVDQLLDQLDAN